MGEFSLTAIDSLSTLALMASTSEVEAKRFWEVVAEVSRIYWCVEYSGCRVRMEAHDMCAPGIILQRTVRRATMRLRTGGVFRGARRAPVGSISMRRCRCLKLRFAGWGDCYRRICSRQMRCLRCRNPSVRRLRIRMSCCIWRRTLAAGSSRRSPTPLLESHTRE